MLFRGALAEGYGGSGGGWLGRFGPATPHRHRRRCHLLLRSKPVFKLRLTRRSLLSKNNSTVPLARRPYVTYMVRRGDHPGAASFLAHAVQRRRGARAAEARAQRRACVPCLVMLPHRPSQPRSPRHPFPSPLLVFPGVWRRVCAAGRLWHAPAGPPPCSQATGDWGARGQAGDASYCAAWAAHAAAATRGSHALVPAVHVLCFCRRCLLCALTDAPSLYLPTATTGG